MRFKKFKIKASSRPQSSLIEWKGWAVASSVRLFQLLTPVLQQLGVHLIEADLWGGGVLCLAGAPFFAAQCPFIEGIWTDGALNCVQL